MAALGDKHMLLNSEGEADFDNITIKPQAPTELFKIIKEEVITLLGKVAKDNGFSKEDFVSKYLDDVSKIGVKMGIKRRNRRSLPKDLQCLGRKIDGHQCTRSRRNGEEFCLSHMKRLPHGRIDDPDFAGKEKGKRGRKKKEVVYNEEEYLCVHLELIRGVQYLLDENNNVFTYNLESPKFLGKREEIEAQ
jgi:hypothetical protein